ncbi:MAG: adenylyl-sulfate kinase [Alphaproteobacteria bacterium]
MVAPSLRPSPVHPSLIRVVVCGSVDDGKSTLIGRLLWDCDSVPEDQAAKLKTDSERYGRAGADLDYSLLLDGLQAEREQAITIDVAYRYLAVGDVRLVIADVPGHEQYTRNMATGASQAEVAVVLVDAQAGIVRQTRRHTNILSVLGVRSVVLAVNKMDQVGCDEAVFDRIAADFRAYAGRLGVGRPGVERIVAVPVIAPRGANVVRNEGAIGWYDGPSVLEAVLAVATPPAQVADAAAGPFRMPVQWVNRPNAAFRGYCGTVAAGRVRPGDLVTVHPGGAETRVRRIVGFAGDLPAAAAGDAAVLELADDIDIGRGAILAAPGDGPGDGPGAAPTSADQLAATVIWMDQAPLLPGRRYRIKFGTGAETIAQVTSLRHRINIETLDQQAARALEINDVGVCNLMLDRVVAFDTYADNRATGAFILIDQVGNRTVGAGMIAFGLRRAQNLTWQAIDVTAAERAKQKGQRPCVLWFTGLSGAGKSTVANLVERRLHAMGKHTYVMDGDNIRHGLNRDLGFTEADRVENVRRVGEVARLFADAGLIVIAALISPFRSERRMVRELLPAGAFIEVFVDTPLDECERRDPKGLYAKARAGTIANFTGISSPYERPEQAEIVLPGGEAAPDELAELVARYLAEGGYV